MTSKLNRWIALAVFLWSLAIYAGASRTQGNTRDEGYYFDAAGQYWGWYVELGENLVKGHPQKSFTRQAIDRWFSYNHEHPALMKTLFGASEWSLHKKIHLLDEEAALRLPTHVASALLIMFVFLFGAGAWSRGAGLVAAALTLGMPRLFFDAQLAAFDAPIAAFWVATTYAYWRSLDSPKWAWRTGLLFGLSLAVKHNAFFLPFVLIVHWLWLHRGMLRRRRLPPIPRAFFWMASLGPLVYLACWPWLWFDTVARWKEYFAFHAHHVYYNMEYLGTNYNKPPFPLSFPYLMTLFTVPATTLALALGGAAALVRSHFAKKADPALAPTVEVTATRPTAPGFLVGLNALFPMVILTVTRAPIFGATKHFHAALPFLALLAGYGFHALVQRRPRAIVVALGILVCLPAAAETFRSHPYGLTHYGLLAGGPAGGADLGLNRQFWGYSTRGILPWLNAHAPPGAPVYWHDTNLTQQAMNKREKRLRPDLRDTGLEEPGVKASDVAMVIHEKHFNKYEYWIWDFYGTARPSVVLTDEGVPIVTVYERPKK